MIGLEVHAYLATASKLFCRCPAAFLSAVRANENVCEVCTAQPGAKPMAPNQAAVRAALTAARLLRCEEAPALRFLRKHYFYPDLPANYQRTSLPLGERGELSGVAVREIHLEEDPGTYELRRGEVDWNRSGAPLVEIVTEPVLGSPAAARAWIEELRLVMQYAGLLGAGGLKADANVSVEGGERVEVKNVNSAHNVQLALAHEIERQSGILASGGRIDRETRHFDEARAVTVLLRAKETAEDYRFVPDPDLPPVELAPQWQALPALEHPHEIRARWTRDLGVTAEAANVLLAERPLARAHEELARAVDPKLAFDFLVRDVKGELNYRSLEFAGSRLTVEGLAALLRALSEGSLTRQAARESLRRWLDGAALEDALGERLGVVGTDEVTRVVEEVLATEADAVAKLRAGKSGTLNFLVGEAMRRLAGRAKPDAVRAEIERRLR
ncbi:MAG TPA: Asp-tRNA(Asn)/Glu-tRNA(Gln) amidotransferase subunit GatB [Candidatus Thermoplasmatota archaeon]|nr:Asp-tRNA(Asn)/Glu-tRNA(Gln) amidotransferase subunit GatB [Candidatus Thermoplasmatota archaeon]